MVYALVEVGDWALALFAGTDEGVADRTDDFFRGTGFDHIYRRPVGIHNGVGLRVNDNDAGRYCVQYGAEALSALL